MALQAALAYFSRDRAGFLRRLPVIAVEDVGIGDVSSVTAVIAATLDARWRARVGGDWVVASYLIGRMCEAPKERSADYLLLAALAHPDFEDECRRLSLVATAELLAVVGDEAAPLPTRAIAAWYLAGTGRLRGTRLPTRRGDPSALFATFHEMGVPRRLVAACQAAALGADTRCPLSCPWFGKQRRRQRCGR